MLTPKEAREQLGVGDSTLRRWSRQFADHLSPMGGIVLGADEPRNAARRFTGDDLALLAQVKRALDAGATVEQVQARLGRGLPPADVVALDDPATTRHEPATQPATAPDAPAVVRDDVLLALVAQVANNHRDLAQAVRDQAAAVERQTAAIEANSAAQQALLARLVARPDPAPAVPTLRARLKALFTGRG